MFRASESIVEVSAALVKALGELSDVPKGREAKIPTKAGSNYSYRYADLGDALSMVRPIFAKHGLGVIQNATSPSDNTVLISTTIIHSSGQFIAFEPLAMPSGRTAQETGSAITYGRRYHLLASLGLATDDDDGASAAPRDAKQSKQSNSKQSRQTQDDEPRPTTRKISSDEARSEEEQKIRDLLAGLTPGEQSRVKQEFVAAYGLLKDLAVELHPDALDFVVSTISNLDREDDEWVALAKGDE